MRLMYQHDKPGSGSVTVKAPRDLPVFVTIDGSFDHRAVEIVINNDRNLAAWAGPSGPRNRNLSVEVGRPSASSFMKDFFGFRTGVSVSGGGVVASGAGGIASGGSITGNATGTGSVVTTGKNGRLGMETGIHLSLPFGCEFSVTNGNDVTVSVGEQEVNLTAAHNHGYLEIP